MSDEEKVVFSGTGEQGPGQDQTPTDLPKADQPTAGQPERTEPEFVTKEMFTKTIEQIRADTQEEVKRWTQSWSDKLESRVVKDVNERFAEVEQKFNDMRAAGMPVTDEMLANARQDIVQQALLQQASQGVDGGGQPDVMPITPEQKAVADFVNQRAAVISQEYGLELENGDPEAATIDQSDPWKFLSSYEAALKAKKDRTANNPPEEETAPAKTPGLVSGGTKTSPISHINNPSELIRQGLEKRRGG